jgi:hypothetical protein
MTQFTSRAQDAAHEIKLAQIAVDKSVVNYRKGGSLDAVNRANAKLADAHGRLYEINSGLVHDDR